MSANYSTYYPAFFQDTYDTLSLYSHTFSFFPLNHYDQLLLRPCSIWQVLTSLLILPLPNASLQHDRLKTLEAPLYLLASGVDVYMWI